ncbi:MAG: 2-amino-4-hydroxy-6-hydroxymethyldihydropteridine diphosphokinase [Candidatus Cloacimonetes bacterium]|nr:2-amino-4-hydroxy-6-hydroxymethyldihydropteridine diphosphokinase [Candidatus Cloacimonadota bacterium]
MTENIVFIGLGSNLGNRKKNLKSAINKIKNLHKISLISKSSIIETKPVGNVNQPDFLNCIIKIRTELNPGKLLSKLLQIEKKMGRIRKKKWEPRIIDLDILFFNDEIINTKNLQIPHPEILKRKFILASMNEIASKFVYPKTNKKIEELFQKYCE